MKKNFLLNVGTRYFFFLIVILVNLTSFSYSENWFISSGDYHSSKYSNLDQINDKNISNLSNAWIFENGFMQIDEVRNAMPMSEYSTEIEEILSRYYGRITAWNRDFDSAFLKNCGFNLGPDIHCPMKESVNYFKLDGPYGYKWPKAQEAWDFLFPETPMIELHRGLADSKMEAAIIYELYQRKVYKPFLV